MSEQVAFHSTPMSCHEACIHIIRSKSQDYPMVIRIGDEDDYTDIPLDTWHEGWAFFMGMEVKNSERIRKLLNKSRAQI